MAALHQPLGDAVLQRRGRQRVADLQHLRRHAGQQHARRTVAIAQRQTARPTTTGSSSPAATASSRASIPTDPNIVYAESQYGGIVRLDRRTSERVSIRPVEEQAASRRCASTGNRRSSSARTARRGCTSARAGCSAATIAATRWQPISPDLTRQTDRNTLPVMGRVWPPEAVAQHQSTATWGNISALSESRKREGLLYVGHRRWADPVLAMTAARNVAARARRRRACPTTATTASTCSASTRRRTTRTSSTRCPRTARTATSSRTSTRARIAAGAWTVDRRRSAGQRTGAAFAEDHVNPEPAVRRHRVRAVLHRRRRQEVDPAAQQPADDRRCATWRSRSARTISCWHVRPRLLRARRLLAAAAAVAGRLFQKDGHIFPTKPAVIEVPETGKARGSQGEQHWMGENRPIGAVITYWVKDAPRTLRQRRQDAARAAEQKKASPRYPTQAADHGGRR